MKTPIIRTWRGLFTGCLGLFFLTFICQGSENPILLKYTYKTDQIQVAFLHDIKGKAYLPLLDVAQFYGVQVQFDAQTRRVKLQKGKNQIKLALSQPVFMVLDPDSSIPIDPVEVVSGQLGITSAAAEDVFGTILNLQVQYLPEQSTLVAGGVRKDELRDEILAQAAQMKNSSAVPTTKTAVDATQVVEPTAVPTLVWTPTVVVEAQPEHPSPEKTQPPSHVSRHIEQIKRIVIDAGHGGNDAGAPGHDRKYHEKQATLDIAQRVVGYLKEEQGLDVLMTRSGDYYITLKYRSDFANSHNADLFVSIHCNSNPRPGAHGTEIYQYGSKASNKLAAVAAARENGTTDYMDYTMADLRTNVYKVHSRSLAEHVEYSIREKLGQHFRNILKAPFYVLAHADMPSILVETAFISNQEEENKLRDPYWRDKMAKAIAEGIIAYKDLVEGMDDNQEARR